MSFTELSLDALLLKALKESGYKAPTEIQTKAIPLVLSGKDVLGAAQTGTGKTAAFVLPILQDCIQSPVAQRRTLHASPRALILSPTRELAQQVSKSCLKYARHIKNFSVVTITGGVPYFKQAKNLNKAIDVLVATPGRLIDCLSRNQVQFDNIQVLVLDEADRMLDMGFRDDVTRIIKTIPEKPQTLLFSATIDKSIKRLADEFMVNPERVGITEVKSENKNVQQRVQYVHDMKAKSRALQQILRDKNVEQSIIFTQTKRSADSVAKTLNQMGFQAEALHSDKRQGMRNRIIEGFRKKRIKFLVGTDVLARGIDVPGVSHVINFDLPRDPEDYVHRIGRTGRADSFGQAITLAYSEEYFSMRRIEKFLGHSVESLKLEGFEEPQLPKEKKEEKSSGGRNRRRKLSSRPRGFSSKRGSKQQSGGRRPKPRRRAANAG